MSEIESQSHYPEIVWVMSSPKLKIIKIFSNY